jgi:hypothetical protein
MKDLAADRHRYRYFESGDRFVANDPPPAPREAVTFEEAVGRPRKPTPPPPAPTPRSGHRYERLPPAFFLEGRLDWLFSAVTFGERTIHGLEIFLPDIADAAPAVETAAPAIVEPEPAVEAAPPYRGPGRPSKKGPIEAEARKVKNSDSIYPSHEAIVKAIAGRVGSKPGTVRALLKDWEFKTKQLRRPRKQLLGKLLNQI